MKATLDHVGIAVADLAQHAGHHRRGDPRQHNAPGRGGGTAGQRFDRLDALRGLAIVWMAAFHFCFDLNHFGFFNPKHNFYVDPFWTWQRVCIVSLFLLCAGAGQALALDAAQPWARFWRRWAQVAGSSGSVQVYELSGLARSMTDCTNAHVSIRPPATGRSPIPTKFFQLFVSTRR